MQRANDMNTKLLDGLEMSLDVYEMSWDSSNFQIAGGAHIYIGHTLELAVWSHWAHFCVGIGTSGTGRRIFRSLTATEVAVGFSDTVAATPGTIG